MNLTMNLAFFDIWPDPNTLFYIGIFGLIAAVAILFYFVVLKPKREYVFPEERKCGPWTLTLGRLGRILVGPVCTARQTYEAASSQQIVNAMKMSEGPNDKAAENLAHSRKDIFESTYFYAQRSQDGDVLLLFDKNPEDQQYYAALGEHRFVIGIQDCRHYGKETLGGLDLIAVKLSKEKSTYTVDEDKLWEQRAEAIKWERLAASNSTEIAHLREMTETKDLLLASKDQEIRKQTTRADTATTAAGIKPLEEPGIPPEKPSIFGAIGRKFLSRSQIIVGVISIIVWFAVTNILRGFGVVVPDPNAMGVLIGIAIFFGTPIVRGWLSERRQG